MDTGIDVVSHYKSIVRLIYKKNLCPLVKLIKNKNKKCSSNDIFVEKNIAFILVQKDRKLLLVLSAVFSFTY